MKYPIKMLFILVSIILISGCASERNIELSNKFWQQKSQKVIVAKTLAPEPHVKLIGAQGLLDIAINYEMAKPINAQLKKADLTWYPALQNNFVKRLQTHGFSASSYNPDLVLQKLVASGKSVSQNSAYNYTGIVAPLNIDTFMVIRLNELGAIRKYYGFIPLNAPSAYCSLTGELINAKDQSLLWRYTAEVTIGVTGTWDQPPAYPNLTKALKMAVKTAQDEVFDNFFSGH